VFPHLELEPGDVSAAYAGLRPLVDRTTRDAARASRDFAIWDEDGLITVTGGKLTTFRPMALQTLQRLQPRLPRLTAAGCGPPVADDLDAAAATAPVSPDFSLRLLARYGADGLAAIAGAPPEERASISGSPWCWAELRWAARAEDVVHLDDLLLRRVRLGLTAPEGARSLLDRIRPVVQGELDWDDARWHWEVARYTDLWQHGYAVAGQSLALPLAEC
jgi:glycerol-3-phosphate dehydrogenase